MQAFRALPSLGGCAILCALAIPAAGRATASADRPSLPAAITSSDGSFSVAAPSATAAYRAPVLTFAQTVKRDLQRATRLTFTAPAHPIAIVLGEATNDAGVAGVRLPHLTGGAYERLDVPDPEHVDLDAIRLTLTQALLREWLMAARSNSLAASPRLPPDWFLGGLARHASRLHRQADFENVYDRWARQRLPDLTACWAFAPSVAVQHPALPAVLAAWLLERPGLFAHLMHRLAEGQVWSPELVDACTRGIGEPAMAEAFSEWLAATVREVRQPGETTPGAWSAFLAELLIYPGDYGIPVHDEWRGRSFEECLKLPRTDALKTAARDRALRLRLAAAGHDGALQRVAAAYAAFLEAWAAGKPLGSVRALLKTAEEEAGGVAARAAAGETLRDEVPSERDTAAGSRGLLQPRRSAARETGQL